MQERTRSGARLRLVYGQDSIESNSIPMPISHPYQLAQGHARRPAAQQRLFDETLEGGDEDYIDDNSTADSKLSPSELTKTSPSGHQDAPSYLQSNYISPNMPSHSIKTTKSSPTTSSSSTSTSGTPATTRQKSSELVSRLTMLEEPNEIQEGKSNPGRQTILRSNQLKSTRQQWIHQNNPPETSGFGSLEKATSNLEASQQQQSSHLFFLSLTSVLLFVLALLTVSVLFHKRKRRRSREMGTDSSDDCGKSRTHEGRASFINRFTNLVRLPSKLAYSPSSFNRRPRKRASLVENPANQLETHEKTLDLDRENIQLVERKLASSSRLEDEIETIQVIEGETAECSSPRALDSVSRLKRKIAKSSLVAAAAKTSRPIIKVVTSRGLFVDDEARTLRSARLDRESGYSAGLKTAVESCRSKVASFMAESGLFKSPTNRKQHRADSRRAHENETIGSLETKQLVDSGRGKLSPSRLAAEMEVNCPGFVEEQAGGSVREPEKDRLRLPGQEGVQQHKADSLNINFSCAASLSGCSLLSSSPIAGSHYNSPSCGCNSLNLCPNADTNATFGPATLNNSYDANCFRSKSQGHSPFCLPADWYQLSGNRLQGQQFDCRPCCSASPSVLNEHAVNGEPCHSSCQVHNNTSAGNLHFLNKQQMMKRHYENYYDDEREDTYRRLTASFGLDFGLGYPHNQFNYHPHYSPMNQNTTTVCYAGNPSARHDMDDLALKSSPKCSPWQPSSKLEDSSYQYFSPSQPQIGCRCCQRPHQPVGGAPGVMAAGQLDHCASKPPSNHYTSEGPVTDSARSEGTSRLECHSSSLCKNPACSCKQDPIPTGGSCEPLASDTQMNILVQQASEALSVDQKQEFSLEASSTEKAEASSQSGQGGPKEGPLMKRRQVVPRWKQRPRMGCQRASLTREASYDLGQHSSAAAGQQQSQFSARLQPRRMSIGDEQAAKSISPVRNSSERRETSRPPSLSPSQRHGHLQHRASIASDGSCQQAHFQRFNPQQFDAQRHRMMLNSHRPSDVSLYEQSRYGCGRPGNYSSGGSSSGIGLSGSACTNTPTSVFPSYASFWTKCANLMEPSTTNRAFGFQQHCARELLYNQPALFPEGAYPIANLMGPVESAGKPYGLHELSLPMCQSLCPSRKYSLPVQLESHTAELLSPNRTNRLLFEKNLQRVDSSNGLFPSSSTNTSSSQRLPGEALRQPFGSSRSRPVASCQSQAGAETRRSSQTITRQSSFWLEDNSIDSILSLNTSGIACPQSEDGSQLDVNQIPFSEQFQQPAEVGPASQRPSVSSLVLSGGSIDSVRPATSLAAREAAASPGAAREAAGGAETKSAASSNQEKESPSSEKVWTSQEERSSSAAAKEDRRAPSTKAHRPAKGSKVRLGKWSSSSSNSNSTSSPSPDFARAAGGRVSSERKLNSLTKRRMFGKMRARRRSGSVQAGSTRAKSIQKQQWPPTSSSTPYRRHKDESEGEQELAKSPANDSCDQQNLDADFFLKLGRSQLDRNSASLERQCRDLWKLRATLHEDSSTLDNWTNYHQRLNRRYDSGYKSMEHQFSSSVEGNLSAALAAAANLQQQQQLASTDQQVSGQPNARLAHQLPLERPQSGCSKSRVPENEQSHQEKPSVSPPPNSQLASTRRASTGSEHSSTGAPVDTLDNKLAGLELNELELECLLNEPEAERGSQSRSSRSSNE